MQWADVVQNQSLQDLPFKIELNEWGQIVMTPASNLHAFYQSKIVWLLRSRMVGGEVFTECSIETDEGVKVADAAWCSDEFFQKYGCATPFPVAPELCVEVVSPSNSHGQMQQKMALYFQKGARECWLLHENGRIQIFHQAGEQQSSLWGIEITL